MYYIASPAIRIAATIVLLAVIAFLFTQRNAFYAPPPQIAIEPPLGTLYLTALSEPALQAPTLVSTDADREEYVVDELNGPIQGIFSKAQPYGHVLNQQHADYPSPSLDVIAFGNPTDPASQALYDNLKAMAEAAENARFLFVPVSAQANTRDVQRLLTRLGVRFNAGCLYQWQSHSDVVLCA